MSKIAVAGNASGTGTLTIAAPNTNSDRTLTLPDATGTFVTADGSGNITIASGTANGVTYLNGSKVLTSGSALTFDGSALAVTGTLSAGNGISYFNNLDANIMLRVGVGITSTLGTGEGLEFSFTAPTAKILSYNRATSAYKNIFIDALTQSFGISGSEGMRLTSTGLGIGTSSPNTKLQVSGNAVIGNGTIGAPASGYQLRITNDSSEYYDFGRSASTGYFTINASQASPYRGFNWSYGGTAQMTLDSSGNLGLGVTPSAWGTGQKALQIGTSGALSDNGSTFFNFNNNCYFNISSWYYKNTAAASQFQSNGNVFNGNKPPPAQQVTLLALLRR